jgi:hypothetical protein
MYKTIRVNSQALWLFATLLILTVTIMNSQTAFANEKDVAILRKTSSAFTTVVKMHFFPFSMCLTRCL